MDRPTHTPALRRAWSVVLWSAWVLACIALGGVELLFVSFPIGGVAYFVTGGKERASPFWTFACFAVGTAFFYSFQMLGRGRVTTLDLLFLWLGPVVLFATLFGLALGVQWIRHGGPVRVVRNPLMKENLRYIIIAVAIVFAMSIHACSSRYHHTGGGTILDRWTGTTKRG